jgi:Ulp1 protease family, C-terminal catalytic domain
MAPKKALPAPVPEVTAPRLSDTLQQLLGRQFNNFSEVLAYLQTLEPADRVSLLAQIRDIVMQRYRNSEDVIEAMYTFIHTDSAFREFTNRKYFWAEWVPVYDAAQRIRTERRRVEEALERIANHPQNGPGRAFVDGVILPLCGGTTAVLDRINIIQGQYPLRNIRQILQNACKRMLLRLEKKVKYNSGELRPTPKDFEDGNMEFDLEGLASAERIAATGFSVTADEFGLIWDRERPSGFLQLWNAPDPGRILGEVATSTATVTTTAPAPTDIIPSIEGLIVPPSSGTPGGGVLKGSRQYGPLTAEQAKFQQELYEREKKALAAAVERRAEKARKDAAAAAKKRPPSGGTEGRSPTSKKARRSPTEVDKSIAKVSSMFHELKITSKAARDRGRQSGRLSTLFIKNHPTPTVFPTPIEDAYWQMILARVLAFKEGRKVVEMPAGTEEVINSITPEMARIAIERIIDGLNAANYDDPNLAVYAQAAYDQAVLMERWHMERDLSVMRMTSLAQHLGGLFRPNTRMVVAEYPARRNGLQDPALRITQQDYETFIRDRNHDGWLSGEALIAALTITLAPQEVYIVNPNAWVNYVNRGFQTEDLPQPPDRPPHWVVIPYHFGNHWALLLFDVLGRNIYFLDSRTDEGRRQMAMRAARAFLGPMAPWMGEDPWTFRGHESNQQVNDYDCGLFVIENARAMVWHETVAPEIVGNAPRLDVATQVFDAIIHHENITHALERSSRGGTEEAAALAQVNETPSARGSAVRQLTAHGMDPATRSARQFAAAAAAMAVGQASVELGNQRSRRSTSSLTPLPVHLEEDPTPRRSSRLAGKKP